MSDFFEIPASGILTDEQLRAVRNGNWAEPALYEALAVTALHYQVDRVNYETLKREHARMEAMVEAFAAWRGHEVEEALKLYRRLNQAGEGRDFPAVALMGLRLLLARTERAAAAEALPCPFCGHETVFFGAAREGGAYHDCESCGARGPVVPREEGEECDEVMARSRTAWNRRVRED